MPGQFFSPEGDLEEYFMTNYWLIDQYIGDKLYAWGFASSGQLGTNDIITRSTPVTTFLGGTDWKQVSSYQFHSAAIKTDGTLWTWGSGSNGILGNASGTSVNTPVTTFAGGSNWKKVSTGVTITAAIKTDGTLWTWGRGFEGAIGNNDITDRNTPVTTFAGGSDWKDLDCGGFHIGAIKTDGTLWVWGLGTSGQLGQTSVVSSSTPITTFAGGTNWKQVSCGDVHTAGIKTDGTLWIWGGGGFGRLGTNDTFDRSTPATTFAGGTNWKYLNLCQNVSWGIKSDGTLWGWGLNSASILGNNNGPGSITPITTFAGGTNWKSVSSGTGFAVALKTDGTLWTWGSNSGAKLGTNGLPSTASTPVTTFTGGTNWRQAVAGNEYVLAVTSGIPSDLPLS